MKKQPALKRAVKLSSFVWIAVDNLAYVPKICGLSGRFFAIVFRMIFNLCSMASAVMTYDVMAPAFLFFKHGCSPTVRAVLQIYFPI